MTDFLVLKKTSGSGPSPADGWSTAAIIRNIELRDEGEAKAAAIKEGYSGEGTYKALEWEDDIEADVGPPAPPEIQLVSRQAQAVEAAEATAAAEAAT